MLSRLLASQWGKFLLFVTAWAAVSLLFVPEAYLSFYVRGLSIGWCKATELTIVNSFVVLALVPGIVWITRRWPIERRHWGAALVAHIPACLVFSLAHSGLYWAACHVWQEVGGTLFFRFHPNLLSYWAVVGFTQALDYLRKYQERERHVTQLKLSLLKSQLQPHFLFNTLHTISAMMHVDVNGADTMISRLSQLLRVTLANIGKDETTLAEELDFIRTYLDIERVRFGERLETRIDAPADILDALVPTMVLQPLVENCVRHGISSCMQDGRITIQAKREEGRLVLRVQDNGAGLSPASPPREGLGLSNTRARLEQLYPQDHLFSLGTGAQGGVEVTVNIPFHQSLTSGPAAEEISSDADSHDYRGRRALGPGEIASLLSTEPDFEVVRSCASGTEAIEAILTVEPHLVFLDVQMPGVDGFGVIDMIGAEAMPLTIFATAHDTHALRAFDSQALDYLLKPFDEARFHRSLERARKELRSGAGTGPRLQSLLETVRPPRHYLQRVVVKSRGRVLFLKACDIDWLEGSGNYVTLHVNQETYLLRETLTALEKKLDPTQFIRLHRSAIVNVDRIKELAPWCGGEQAVFLLDGTQLTIGRAFRDRITALLKNCG